MDFSILVSEEEYKKVKQPKIKIQACKAIKNNLGKLNYIIEEGESSYYGNLAKAGIGGAIGGISGGIGGGILGAIGVGAGIAALPVVGISVGVVAGIGAGIGAIIGLFKGD